jgi:hypothetical protein
MTLLKIQIGNMIHIIFLFESIERQIKDLKKYNNISPDEY